MALNVHLMIIDPQNDFMGEDDGSPYQVTMTSGRVLKASLSVKGGVSDVGRLAKLVLWETPRNSAEYRGD